MARRFSKIRHAEVKLAPAKPVRAKWKAKIKEDPWKISLAQKVMPLIEAEKRMLSRSGVDSTSGALDLNGLDVSREMMKELLAVDSHEWLEDLKSQEEFYAPFGERLPREIKSEWEALRKRLKA